MKKGRVTKSRQTGTTHKDDRNYIVVRDPGDYKMYYFIDRIREECNTGYNVGIETNMEQAMRIEMLDATDQYALFRKIYQEFELVLVNDVYSDYVVYCVKEKTEAFKIDQWVYEYLKKEKRLGWCKVGKCEYFMQKRVTSVR